MKQIAQQERTYDQLKRSIGERVKATVFDPAYLNQEKDEKKT